MIANFRNLPIPKTNFSGQDQIQAKLGQDA